MPRLRGEAFEGGVRFLVDAQLPRSLAGWLQQRGHDVVHTLDLPDGNKTKDSIVLQMANRDGRTLVTKDADFRQSFERGKGPPKLLLVTSGNIANRELLELFERNEATIIGELQKNHFVEVNRGAVIVHC